MELRIRAIQLTLVTFSVKNLKWPITPRLSWNSATGLRAKMVAVIMWRNCDGPTDLSVPGAKDASIGA
jgi:hypothetical protein